LYGAITNYSTDIILTQEDKTNSDGVIRFLLELKDHAERYHIDQRPWLILDNHGVHYARRVRPYLQQFRPLFVPSYSSDLSSVEVLWAILKARMDKEALRFKRDLTQIQYEAEVDRICQGIQEDHDGSRLFTARKRQLLEALDAEDVAPAKDEKQRLPCLRAKLAQTKVCHRKSK